MGRAKGGNQALGAARRNSALCSSAPTALFSQHRQSTPESVAELLHSDAGQRGLAALSHGIIFDMDDTLNSNQALFSESQEKLVTYYDSLAPNRYSRQQLLASHNEHDHGLIATLGYTPLRWHTSAQDVGARVAGRPLTPVESAQVREHAEHAMGVGHILPGVERALSALSRAGVTMALKTKGDLAKQREKLAAHRFDRYFSERITIVDRKNEDTFRNIVSEHGLGRVVSIGDSERSDILPALAAGHDAIHIDHGAEAWSFERSASEETIKRAPSMPHALLHLLRSPTAASK